jgi:hypothetical protein
MEGCLQHVYRNLHDSGKSEKWEGLDVPASRSLKVDDWSINFRLVTSSDTFGQMYMNADPWHTNAAGCELIIQALLRS